MFAPASVQWLEQTVYPTRIRVFRGLAANSRSNTQFFPGPDESRALWLLQNGGSPLEGNSGDLSLWRLGQSRIMPHCRIWPNSCLVFRMIGKSTMIKKDFAIEKYGRTEWIRTTDLHGPIVARYQTALRPDPLTNQHFQKPDASGEDSPVKHSDHLLQNLSPQISLRTPSNRVQSPFGESHLLARSLHLRS